ncbi:MAG: 50S ribosomal protein L3 [Candidatus Aenigmatarchaeota archaeon]
MARGHKPRAGSRAFWPKKRAKRIYPRLRAEGKEPKPLGFAAYKAGMTQAVLVDTRKGSVTQGEDVVKSVTVLDCPALIVCGIKAYRSTTSGLVDLGVVWTEKIAKDLNRKTRLPKAPKKKLEDLEKELERISEVRLLVHTKPRESGMRKKTPELFELPLGGDAKQQFEYAKGKLGSEIKVGDVFTEGDSIDVVAVTKGKGFQGPVKRFGVTIRPRKHEKKRRHIGVLGPRNVARVLPGKLAMAGQLGFQTRTEWNKRIVKLGSGGLAPKGGFLNYGLVRGDYLVLEGSVPGPRKRLIMLRPGLRAPETKESVQLKEVHLHSPQGA